MTAQKRTAHDSVTHIDVHMQRTLAATEASRQRQQKLTIQPKLRVLDATDKATVETAFDGSDILANDEAQDRAVWRQRLVDAERGFTHAIRSESTLIGYTVIFGVASLAAGVLAVPGSQLLMLGFVFVQAVVIELVRIAVRELSQGQTKAEHVATAASLITATLAVTTAAVILCHRLLDTF